MLIKEGKTTEHDVRELIKYADADECVLILNMVGMIKKGDGTSDKDAVVVFATGDRATAVKKALKDILE